MDNKTNSFHFFFQFSIFFYWDKLLNLFSTQFSKNRSIERSNEFFFHFMFVLLIQKIRCQHLHSEKRSIHVSISFTLDNSTRTINDSMDIALYYLCLRAMIQNNTHTYTHNARIFFYNSCVMSSLNCNCILLLLRAWLY